MERSVMELDVGGISLRLAPLRVGHLLEIEVLVIRARRDPLALLAERWHLFDERQRRELLEAGFEFLSRPAAATFTELMAWLNTPLGIAQALWIAGRDAQPELTWEACRELVLSAPPETLEQIQQALAPAMWERDVGNSCGQTWLDEVASLGNASFAS